MRTKIRIASVAWICLAVSIPLMTLFTGCDQKAFINKISDADGAKKTASAFFDALSKGDADTAGKYISSKSKLNVETLLRLFWGSEFVITDVEAKGSDALIQANSTVGQKTVKVFLWLKNYDQGWLVDNLRISDK